MRIAPALAAVVLLGSLVVTPAFGSSCARAVEWNGTRYTDAGNLSGSPNFGRSVGSGVVPSCSEAGGCGRDGDEHVSVVSVAGVSANVAVAVEGMPEAVYLAPGYFAYLPGEPLHDAVVGTDAPKPNRRRGLRCREPFSLEGRVAFTPVGGTFIRVRVSDAGGSASEYHGRTLALEVDAQTRFERLERGGIPYVQEGDPIAAEGVLCLGGGGAFLYAVDRLSPA